MDPEQNDPDPQRRLVEALILASPEPLPAKRLADLVPRCPAERVRELVAELNAEYAARGRAFEICEVAGGFQMRTLPEFAPYVQQLQSTRPLRLSPAALETLAVVAYRQPVTRAEVEFVRGVDVGAVLRGLLERKLLRIAGHREVPGRPMLYATARRFLEVFGLASLDDLPTLREIRELAPEGTGADRAPAAGPADAEAGSPAAADAEAADLDDEDLDPALRAFEEAEPVGEPH